MVVVQGELSGPQSVDTAVKDNPHPRAIPRSLPYWWEAGEPLPVQPLTQRCDVVIIGSGYTGLSAALRLARGGCSVAVLEARQPGFGASTRNGGMVSGVLKHDFDRLAGRVGTDRTRRIFAEAQASVLFLERLIEDEDIACDYRRTGMYFAAYKASHYAQLEREGERLQEHGIETTMVRPDQQQTELGTDFYHGGRILHLAGGLHPGRMHRGLLERCLASGVEVHGDTPVTAVERSGLKWRLASPRGDVLTDEVIVATNGYTGPPFDYCRRRIIPIGSYMIATEPLPGELARTLIPGKRMIQDTKKVLFYFRMSPDGQRILFGGRTSFRTIDEQESAKRLHRQLSGIFPALRDVRLSHTWSGNVAFTFDALPHLGNHAGIHFSMGYCGQGVAMSTYLGSRLAAGILGHADAETVFSEAVFPGRPLYTGYPWFLPLVGEFYRLLDRLGR